MLFQPFFSKLVETKLFRQLIPAIICLCLFVIFMTLSTFFISDLINPFSTEKIVIHFQFVDFLVGFFLYFVTAVDYALIVGRMQITNPSTPARMVMNIFTCLGCFFGVTLVLFLWGFAKEVDWLIIALLIFAGSVMVKLAYEGLGYFKDDARIWLPLRWTITKGVTALHHLTQGLTFWIPELGSPSQGKMALTELAKWSFLLPFIIGLDDFVGYMGAMTIYNVFSLLIGIYIADVAIDILIFASPVLTKKLVQNPIFSLLASLAFLYLMYKSFSEAFLLILHVPDQAARTSYIVFIICIVAYLVGRLLHGHIKRRGLVRNEVAA